MDFVIELPKTKNGFDAIVCFVDRISKNIRLAPMTTKTSAKDVANLFFHNIYRNFGLPTNIISDRDVRFTSKFWKSLFEQLRTKLKMSTAFHPETDGQTEVMNKIVETMIRHYVSHKLDDWDRYLTHLKFAYNSSINSTTGYSPFKLLLGYEPRSPGDLLHKEDTNVQDVEAMLKDIQSSRLIAQDFRY